MAGISIAQTGYGQFIRREQAQDPESPDFESLVWRDMHDRWELIDDLLKGTGYMRELGIKWTPKEPREQWSRYWLRLHRSFLFEGLKNGVNNVVSRPFSREMTIEGMEELDWLETLNKDADLQGRDLTTFSKEVFQDGVEHGFSHILVDYPEVPLGLSAGEEAARNIRPYFVHIRANDLFYWRETVVNQVKRLKEIRFKSRQRVSTGSFGEDEEVVITQIVAGNDVLNAAGEVIGFEPGFVRKWRRDREQKPRRLREHQSREVWVPLGEPTPFTFPRPYVPLATFYTNFKEFMQCEPPLEALAWKNLEHWLSSSDQNDVLRVARIGLLHRAGATASEAEEGITISPSSLVVSRDAQARLEYVEYNGQAIEAGRNNLNDLKDEMALFGIKPLMNRSGDVTATARVLDHGAVDADAQTWVTEMGCTIKLAAEFWGIWAQSGRNMLANRRLGFDLPKDVRFLIFRDFALSMRTQNEIQELREMRKDKLISHETFINELKKRGTLSDTVDAEEEATSIKTERREMLEDMQEFQQTKPPTGAPEPDDRPPTVLDPTTPNTNSDED